ncbi:aminomethyl-transferring glycine dehydrogenase subunit GcvPA [Azotosporobacter soli]|uniref:aminomethyl-transferring glycine dehydrogenase subunit GcvPA n=1 Tax=Azotosporobacter soli TaxID=3055040 RepID=UPI0031FF08BA
MKRSYLPHTDDDRKAMLEAIGVKKAEELFVDIPATLRLQRPLDLPAALAEPDLAEELKALAGKNASLSDHLCFLGAGAYDHYIPSVVDHVLGRSEFYTAYTQYQPEISQGYLQALWEYQSMICEITGMDVANASMYDGGTAVAEAAMLACGATNRRGVVAPATLHPHYRTILGTYGIDRDYAIADAPQENGVTDLAQLKAMVNGDTAAVILQYPNFFGCIEDVKTAAEIAHAQGALLIVAADPIALGLLEAPGNLGADVVVGEGQAMGIPLSFGGPYLGFFAATEKLIRKMPGRIVGQTTDHEGTRGFVLTLQAREQHIRREKANSNICSNEALCALAATVYLAAVGKEGFSQVANLSLQKAHYAYESLLKLDGVSAVFAAPFFKEFVIRCAKPIAEINERLLGDKIIGGLDLGRYDEKMQNCMLVCVTEKRSKAEIDRFVERLGAIL